jgi:predicted PurR-regulated permease PerM
MADRDVPPSEASDGAGAAADAGSPPEAPADAREQTPEPGSGGAPGSSMTGSAVRPPRRRLPPLSPRVALLGAAALLAGIVLWMGRGALGPFIVGALFVYLLDPIVERLNRRRVPRGLSILLTYLAAAIVIVEGLNLMLRPLVEQIRQFVADLPSNIQLVQAQLERLGAIYRGLELPPALKNAVDEWIAKFGQGDIGFDPSLLVPVVVATTGVLGALLAFLIVPVWAFYLLKDMPALRRSFDAALPPEWRDDVWAVVRIVDRVFGSWVRGQLFLGLAVGIATFAGLLLLGSFVDPIFTRFAVLLAVIAGILELLPIIGPIIAAVPAVLLAATAGLEPALAALILYTLIQQLENNLLVPKIQGDATDLHPSAVMFALVIGGAVAGLLGAILALPVAATARDVYRYLFRRLSVPVDA